MPPVSRRAEGELDTFGDAGAVIIPLAFYLLASGGQVTEPPGHSDDCNRRHFRYPSGSHDDPSSI
jgi:hypothetical protein